MMTTSSRRMYHSAQGARHAFTGDAPVKGTRRMTFCGVLVLVDRVDRYTVPMCRVCTGRKPHA